MRALPAALLALVLVPLAGCLDSGTTPAETQDAPEAEPAPAPSPLEGQPEFCESEDACDFWDEMYHQYVVYDLDTTVIDVLIVPPAGAALQGIQAARMAVQAWADGIEAMGAPWLTGNFTMNVYAVGIDVPTADAVQDPEIVVAATALVGLAGIGLEPKQVACAITGGPAPHAHAHGGGSYPVHAHDGMEILASDCTGYGFTCFALNAGSFDTRGLYDLIAHEVGHCLGAGHVGDALDFRARYVPVEDIMSYQSNPDQVHCVSNMNVRNLEGVYAHLLGRPAEEFLPAGSFMEFPPADYVQAECGNPPA